MRANPTGSGRPRAPWLAVIAAAAITVTACGGPSGGSQAPSTGPTVPIDTIADDGTVVTEVGRAAASTAGAAGGSLTATGSNGVAYTMTVPAGGALRPLDLRLTPVRELRTLSVGTVVGTVKMEPSGSIFPIPVELTLPVPAATEGTALYALLTDDNGATWEILPVERTAAGGRVRVHHFSLVSIILADVNDRGLEALKVSSRAAETLRRRILAAAAGVTAAEALPVVRPLLLEWLRAISTAVTTHVPDAGGEGDQLGFLGDIGDYVALRRLATDEINFYLKSGTLPDVLGEADFAPLAATVNERVGIGILRALSKLQQDCAKAVPLSTVVPIAKEGFGWGGLDVALGAAGIDLGTGAIADEAGILFYVCPHLVVDKLAIAPDPAQSGQHQHLTGQLLVDFTNNVRTQPGEFLPKLGIKMSITPKGTVDDRPIEKTIGPDGKLDIELPLPAGSGGVSVNGKACLDTSDADLRRVCVPITSASGADEPTEDLTGRWGGGILQQGDFKLQVVIDVALKPDASSGATRGAYAGDFFNVHISDGPIPIFGATGHLSVTATGDSVVVKLTYDNGPTRAPCHGTFQGVGNLSLGADIPHISVQLEGSDCNGQHSIRIEMSRMPA